MMATKIKSLEVRLIALICVFLICSCSADAQTSIEKGVDILPMDSSIRYGRLSNGFTYFIKPITDTNSGIEMRLIHKVGSNQEEDDQLNMAHAVEHIAFKGSDNFPFGILDSKLIEDLGVENINSSAFSGRRSTVYNFEVFNGRLKGVEAGLLWYRDIATGLKLTSGDIETVRGEVKQEFLGKVGTRLEQEHASSQMYREIFPCDPKEVDYIAYYENNFSQEALKRFYKKWYHPESLALSVVGDISNPDELERLIEKMFSDIPPSEKSLKLRNCDSLYFNRPSKFVVVERKKDPTNFIEDSSGEIHLFFREPFLQQVMTEAKLERLTDFKLLLEVVKQRFRDAAKQYELSSVMIHDLHNLSLPPGIEISFSLGSGTGKKPIKQIGHILSQLKEHGISQKEFEKVREKQLTNLKQSDIIPSKYWLNQMQDFYVRGEALPADKMKYLSKYLEETTADDFNYYLKTFWANGPDDIGVIASSGHNALSFKEEELRKWITETLEEPVEPFKVPETPHLMSAQEYGKLKESAYIEKEVVESGAGEFLFENGVRLVLKRNSSEHPDMPLPILLHGFVSGGAKSLPEEDYWSAINAPGIIRNSGMNGLDKFQIDRLLSNTSIVPGAVSPYIDYAERGIYGMANPEDLEVMMQLVYLYFTKPNRNENAFEDWKSQMTNSYLNYSGNHSNVDYLNSVRLITGDKSMRASTFRKSIPGGTLGYKSVAKTDFSRAFDIYKEFFENASGFTFIITGDFKEGEVLPFAQKYLGNLPGSVVKKSGAKEGDTQEFTEGPSFHEILNAGNYKMPNVSYGTMYIKKATVFDDWQEQIKVEALGEVVRQKILNLRFKKGYGLYDIAARGKFNDDLKRYEISNHLFCDSKDLQQLQQEVRNVFTEIKEGSFSSTELKSALGLVNKFNVSERAKRRGSFNHSVYRHYRYGQPWVEPAVIEEFIGGISKSDIMEVAQKYFKSENFHEFVLREDAP